MTFKSYSSVVHSIIAQNAISEILTMSTIIKSFGPEFMFSLSYSLAHTNFYYSGGLTFPSGNHVWVTNSFLEMGTWLYGLYSFIVSRHVTSCLFLHLTIESVVLSYFDLPLSSIYHILLIMLHLLSSYSPANISVYHLIMKTSSKHSFTFSPPLFNSLALRVA